MEVAATGKATVALFFLHDKLLASQSVQMKRIYKCCHVILRLKASCLGTLLCETLLVGLYTKSFLMTYYDSGILEWLSQYLRCCTMSLVCWLVALDGKPVSISRSICIFQIQPYRCIAETAAVSIFNDHEERFVESIESGPLLTA